MTPEHDAYYYLASDIDIVPLDNGNVLFRSDSMAVRIEGESARLLVDQILPLLDRRRPLSEVAMHLPGLSLQELRHHLDALTQAQILRVSGQPQGQETPDAQRLAPFLTLLETLGIPPTKAQESLRRQCVAIFGLEAHGAHLAATLAGCGLGNLVLVDPFPCELGNQILMPLLGAGAIGTLRQDALKTLLTTRGPQTEIRTGGEEPLTRERVAAITAGCHLMIGCFDKGYSAINHWINQASLEREIPAMYAESRGHTAIIGPFVLPGQTACYMCYRMRSIACEENFNEAMSYEEFLDQRRSPALHQRGALPGIPPYIASLLSLETLKRLLFLGQPALAGNVLEFDALTLRTHNHAVLQKPDCPVCLVKKRTGTERIPPTLR